MISIKRFLSNDQESVRTLVHVVRILIQGLGEHAAEGDAEVCARYRESIQEILDMVTDDVDPDRLVLQASAALSALSDHTRRMSRQRNLQATELQNMVTMLTSTVGAVSAASHGQVSRLSEIERQVAMASDLDDVRTIKAKLSECLDDIRKEAQRQRKETGDIIEELTEGLAQSRKCSAGVVEAFSLDSVTGLPVRAGAEMTLTQAVQSERQVYAAVLVLDRLQTLNLRFGREVGDEVLVAFARMVQKHLGAADLLFRWSGPALLVVLASEHSLERVRGEVRRIVDTKVEHTIETPSRSILLPIAARWAVFPMMEAPRLLFQKIDAFAAIAAPRD